MRRTAIALAFATALSIGVASAASMGGFDAPVATGLAGDVEPCTYTDVTLLDTFGVDISTSLSPFVQLGAIELTGVTGNCDDHVPIPVIEGFDLALSGPKVIFVLDTQFPPLGPADTGTVTLTLGTPIPLGDGVALFHVPTETRVGFCPGSSTCT